MSESSWLERELQAGLAPVVAPAGLWYRIQAPKGTGSRLLWPVIAVLMLLASAELLWQLRAVTRPSSSELAAIAADSDQCDLWSTDPARIRQWVKTHSGIEIALPPHSTSARLVGARVLKVKGTTVASLAFESSGRRGNMLVWRGEEHARHAAPTRDAQLISWTQGENVFAVSAANEMTARGACMLCHPEGTHGI